MNDDMRPPYFLTAFALYLLAFCLLATFNIGLAAGLFAFRFADMQFKYAEARHKELDKKLSEPTPST